jgi:hypothetical protein
MVPFNIPDAALKAKGLSIAISLRERISVSRLTMSEVE